MDFMHIAAVVLVLAAAFSFLAQLAPRVPLKIGILLLSLAAFLVLLGLDRWTGADLAGWASRLASSVDFSQVVLEGFLGFLLFAGALEVELADLWDHRREVSILATLGVLVSTFLVGGAVYALARALGLGLDLVHALLFGALISPTDPIAVMALFRSLGAPRALQTKVTGESLFNDGIGVVVFLVILGLLTRPAEVTVSSVLLLLVVEVLGGVAFGLAAGLLAYLMLRRVDNYPVEVLITLALVVGGYVLAGDLHVSAPIAMVVAGLFIGNRGRRLAMSENTRLHLDHFWEMVDDLLNVVLFVLIGLEVLVIAFDHQRLWAGALAVPLVLLARWLSVRLSLGLLGQGRANGPAVVRVLIWGGLRGGISVALALSLPADASRELILTMTYVVVVFSIGAQGLTLPLLLPAARRELGTGPAPPEPMPGEASASANAEGSALEPHPAPDPAPHPAPDRASAPEPRP
ncbi:MAG: sodium:proton antiporter [Deltaproteobacteria bacterium]|nr:sodium:proton antiporter [Deltaproteobacteria bacterium]